MGLIHSLPANVADARERWQQRLRRWHAGERCSDGEEDDEGGLSEVVVIGGGDTGEEPAGGKAASMQNRQANAAGDRKTSPRSYLPEVDTDDAVKIWCSRSQPSQVTPSGPSGPSAWLAAEQERSSSSGSEYEPEDEEDEDEEEGSSERSTETTTSSTSTIPSGMLRQWRRIRKCYADNPDVIGEIHVYRVLTYMGHPPLAQEQLRSIAGRGQPEPDDGAAGNHGAAVGGPAPEEDADGGRLALHAEECPAHQPGRARGQARSRAAAREGAVVAAPGKYEDGGPAKIDVPGRDVTPGQPPDRGSHWLGREVVPTGSGRAGRFRRRPPPPPPARKGTTDCYTALPRNSLGGSMATVNSFDSGSRGAARKESSRRLASLPPPGV
ncbi:hypothetical protein MTO96_024588 [Rhipicephalus appendiculatus]